MGLGDCDMLACGRLAPNLSLVGVSLKAKQTGKLRDKPNVAERMFGE